MIEQAVEALRDGRPVVLPTDTVYGLCADPSQDAPAREIFRLKQRPAAQPLALLAKDVEYLFELVPELRGRVGTLARALLPGPFTLVLPNPAERFPWLTGNAPQTIGVRVPQLPAPSAEVLRHVGAVVATSANLHGGPESRTVADIPIEIRAAAAAIVEGGELPGTPSTVLDLTGREPRVLREGAVPAAEALGRVGELLRRAQP